MREIKTMAFLPSSSTDIPISYTHSFSVVFGREQDTQSRMRNAAAAYARSFPPAINDDYENAKLFVV